MSDPPLSGPGQAAPPAADWRRTLVRHWRYRQWLKVLGICAFLWLFFIAYFELLRHPARPPTVMPLTPLDQWIAFRPGAIWAYASLWIYVGIAPGLQSSTRALVQYGAWAGALCLAGLACFWLWPTAVPAPSESVDAAVATDATLALIRGVDAAGNACPSLHVATAVFSACWIQRMLSAIGTPAWLRGLSLLWLAAIMWSTVALRQHVVLDVVAGAALGLMFGMLSLRWGPAPTAVARMVQL